MTTQLIDERDASRALERDEGERLWIAGDTLWLKATAAETGGAYTLIEVLAAPGGGPPPHTHANEDEAFYVLDGTFELLVGDRLLTAGQGACAFVPRGTIHRFRCIGGQPGRLLILFTPGGIEGFFREAGRPATGDGPPPPVDADEIARTEAAGAKYGLQVVGWGD
jgi:quercetin dioxygenase-like cupin family protein